LILLFFFIFSFKHSLVLNGETSFCIFPFKNFVFFVSFPSFYHFFWFRIK
jgi:hypothetical protein